MVTQSFLFILEIESQEPSAQMDTRLDSHSEDSKPVPVKQHIGMRKEHVNYRGYSNLHQLRLYNALKSQSEKGSLVLNALIQLTG